MSTIANSKRKGARAELDLADWLIGGGRDAVRQHLAGVHDEGDILVLHGNASVTVIEVKHCARLDIGAWLRELDAEIANCAKHRPGVQVDGILVVRPRGITDPAAWWTIRRLGHGL